MKKYIVSFLAVLYIMTSPKLYVFAGSSSDTDNILTVEGFEVTSGVNKLKETESTFDKTRTISGTAEQGTEIYITVYEVAGSEDKKTYDELDSYELIVGPSGIFSQSINLSIGENYITVEAKNDNKVSKFSTTIKRKKTEIKLELQQNIALPGLNTVSNN